MNTPHASLFAALTLLALLSACDKSPPTAHSGAAARNGAEQPKVAAIEPNPATPETPANDSNDLAAASERMRQTSMKIRADIEKMRESRSRMEATQEAERRQEAEQASQKAINDAAELAPAKGGKQHQAKGTAARAEQAEREHQAALAAQRAKEEQTAQAERERQAALTAQRAKEEEAAKRLAAKARAAEALKAALQSAGPKAYE